MTTTTPAKGSTIIPFGTKSPLNLSSVSRVRNASKDYPQALASDLENIQRVINELHKTLATVPVMNTHPEQILVTNQAGIAALKLSGGDTGKFVYVTDYYHMLAWDGTEFSFADGGSNYYTVADENPAIGGTASGGGWLAVDGSETVNFLQVNGKLGTRNLADTVGNPSYLKVGTGTGALNSPVAPTLTMNSYTPAGVISIPLLTMNSYTPAGTNSAPTLTMNSYTPAGSVSAPVFTGTASGTTGATAGVVNVVPAPYTPAGTNSAPTFTGTPATLTGAVSAPVFTGTPAVLTGTISRPTFTGTPAVLTGTISADGQPANLFSRLFYRQ